MQTEIKIISLGGQDERGKNCYIIEINDEIFVFDAGIKIPINGVLGISMVTADFTYLAENKKKIKGIFIGTNNFFNIGGLYYLIQKLNCNVEIYTTIVGKTIIETYLTSKNKTKKVNYTINVIEPLKSIDFKNSQVYPFKISNHSPMSVGWIIKTKIGSIVYIDEFFVNNEKSKLFSSQLQYINSITKNNVLCLLVGLGNVRKFEGFTAPNFKAKAFYEGVLQSTNKRIFIALNDYNIYNILLIASLAKNYARPFIIYGSTLINTFDVIVKNKFFNSKNLITLPISEIENVNNAIVVLSGTEEALYKKLFAIADNQINSVKLNSSDTFVLGTYLVPGYEFHAAQLIDKLSKMDIKTFVLPKTVLPMTASQEDHKYLIDILKPEFILGIKGYYMDFVSYQKTITNCFIKPENVIFLDNSDALIIKKDNFKIENKYVKNLTENYITHNGTQDSNYSILSERKQMGESGIVLVTLYIDKIKKQFLNKIDFKSYGLINTSLQNYLIDEIKEKFLSSLQKVFKNPSQNNKDTKIFIKKVLIKIFEKKLLKKPLILPLIIEI